MRLPGSSALGFATVPAVEYGPDNRAPTPPPPGDYRGPSAHANWQGNSQLGPDMNVNANDPSLRYPTPERSEAGSPRIRSRSTFKDRHRTMKRRRIGSDEDEDDDDASDDQNATKRSRVRYSSLILVVLFSYPLVGLHSSTITMLLRTTARTSRQTRRKV